MAICAKSVFLSKPCRKPSLRLTYLANTAIPSTGHPDPIRALTIPGSLAAALAMYFLTMCVDSNLAAGIF